MFVQQCLICIIYYVIDCCIHTIQLFLIYFCIHCIVATFFAKVDLTFTVFECGLTLILPMYSLISCFADMCFICIFYCKISALVIGSLKAIYLLT